MNQDEVSSVGKKKLQHFKGEKKLVDAFSRLPGTVCLTSLHTFFNICSMQCNWSNLARQMERSCRFTSSIHLVKDLLNGLERGRLKF